MWFWELHVVGFWSEMCAIGAIIPSDINSIWAIVLYTNSAFFN